MGRVRILFLALASCGVAVPAWSQACPQPLRVGFNDSPTPPGLMGHGARFADPPGWEVLAVRDALRRLGCDAQLLRLPPRRLSASLVQGSLDFALLYGATPERLRTLRFPLNDQGQPDLAWAPVFGSLTLFSRAGTAPDPAWDGQRLPTRWRVGVIAGSVQETLARQRGWRVESIAVAGGELNMLQAGRFDLLLSTREALTPQQREALVAWPEPVARLPYYMPASSAFEQRHPGWTRSFWREFCRAVRRLAPESRPADCGIVPAAALR